MISPYRAGAGVIAAEGLPHRPDRQRWSRCQPAQAHVELRNRCRRRACAHAYFIARSRTGSAARVICAAMPVAVASAARPPSAPPCAPRTPPRWGWRCANGRCRGLQVEQRGGVLGRIEDEGGALVDRHGTAPVTGSAGRHGTERFDTVAVIGHGRGGRLGRVPAIINTVRRQ